MNGEEEKSEYLVLDAGAIIRGHGNQLFTRAINFVTISEVIEEIRDSKSRELLSKLPYEIKELIPSAESISIGNIKLLKL
jgi:rRNA maturation endonuclease Nob1